MECPACKEALIVLELEEVEIDHCLGCRGIWLDEGELELLLEENRAARMFLQSFTVEPFSREKSRKCPICRKKMEKVLCGTDQKIQIDKCKRNHGLWFDHGELEETLTLGSIGPDRRVLNLLQDMFGGPKPSGENKQN